MAWSLIPDAGRIEPGPGNLVGGAGCRVRPGRIRGPGRRWRPVGPAVLEVRQPVGPAVLEVRQSWRSGPARRPDPFTLIPSPCHLIPAGSFTAQLDITGSGRERWKLCFKAADNLGRLEPGGRPINSRIQGRTP